MGDTVELWIAEEYSSYPAGRDDNDGPFNGTKFRETVLLPKLTEAMSQSRPLVVHLDGVMSFGSSFLEEAFGGLVRNHHVKKNELLDTLQIKSDWPGASRYRDAILRYIKDAH